MKRMHETSKKIIRQRRIAGRDIILNVSFKDSLIRFGLVLLIPILVFLVDKRLVIYVSPICAYLFLTALIQFCIVKYLWHRYILHDPPHKQAPYGKDPNYPDESI